jgi:ketosteroid isomerase-like protein
MFEFDTPQEDFDAIKAFFDEWGDYVANVDFVSSRPFFDERAIGFGTWMDMVEGRDRLENEQWRSIWPTIEGFTHLTDELRVGVSPDRLMAFGLVVWTSTGFHKDGEPYERPGRTTAIFVRSRPSDPWRVIHTHVSLYRGVPQKSHGDRPKKV